MVRNINSGHHSISIRFIHPIPGSSLDPIYPFNRHYCKEIKPFDPLYAIPNDEFPDGTAAEVFEPIIIEMPVPQDAGVKDATSTVTITMSLMSRQRKTSGKSMKRRRVKIS